MGHDIVLAFTDQFGVGSIVVLAAMGAFWFQWRADRRSSAQHAILGLKEENAELAGDVHDMKVTNDDLAAEILKLRAKTDIEKVEKLITDSSRMQLAQITAVAEQMALLASQVAVIAASAERGEAHTERISHILDKVEKRGSP